MWNQDVIHRTTWLHAEVAHVACKAFQEITPFYSIQGQCSPTNHPWRHTQHVKGKDPRTVQPDWSSWRHTQHVEEGDRRTIQPDSWRHTQHVYGERPQGNVFALSQRCFTCESILRLCWLCWCCICLKRGRFPCRFQLRTEKKNEICGCQMPDYARYERKWVIAYVRGAKSVLNVQNLCIMV